MRNRPQAATATGRFLHPGVSCSGPTVGAGRGRRRGGGRPLRARADRPRPPSREDDRRCPGQLVHAGDTLAVAGNHDELFPLLNTIGEVDDPELIAFPLENCL